MIGKTIKNYISNGEDTVILFEDGYLCKFVACLSYDIPYLHTSYDYKPDKWEQEELGMITTEELDELIEQEDKQECIRKKQEAKDKVIAEEKEYLRLKELYGT